MAKHTTDETKKDTVTLVFSKNVGVVPTGLRQKMAKQTTDKEKRDTVILIFGKSGCSPEGVKTQNDKNTPRAKKKGRPVRGGYYTKKAQTNADKRRNTVRFKTQKKTKTKKNGRKKKAINALIVPELQQYKARSCTAARYVPTLRPYTRNSCALPPRNPLGLDYILIKV